MNSILFCSTNRRSSNDNALPSGSGGYESRDGRGHSGDRGGPRSRGGRRGRGRGKSGDEMR